MARAGHSAASGRALHETGAVQETVSDEQKDDLAALRTAALTTEAAVLKLAGTDTGDPGFGKATDKTKRLTDQVTRAGDALERLATGTGDDLAVARIRAATVGNLPERARRTFGRFPGPDDGERVPDGTTIRRLPEAPVRTGAVEKPFARSDAHPGDAGYPAMGGQTVDATIVAAPRQRMTDAGKEIVRGGGIPADWQANPRKPAQKDRDAR